MPELGNDLALTIIRIAVGLVLAGHGAQKLFGAFDGQGLERWHGMVAGMGFAQPRLFATLAAFAEFFGGIMLAIGLLVPVVAAMLAIDMVVAIVKVHWSKGLWVTKGGYEYPLVLFVVLCVLGLAGPTRWSVDGALGIGWGVAAFVAVFLIGGLITAGAAVAEQGAQRVA